MRARQQKSSKNPFFNEVVAMATMETHAEQSGTKKREEEQAHKEGPVARAIEEQTAKLPSDIFLWAAGAAIVASLGLQLIGSRRGILDMFRPARAPTATFVGMWAPTLLLLGIYNKIVKVAGSDRASQQTGSPAGR
jgi:hypothetical protein